MGAFTGARINWTESDRLLLVRTVMHVEEEIRNKTDIIRPVVRDSILRRMEKWERINSLLTPKLQSRRWCVNRKVYDYKCRNLFQAVLTLYRSRKGKQLEKGQKGRRCESLTQPVYDIIKEREDFLNSRRSVQSEVIHSKSGASNTGYGCTRSKESESGIGEGPPQQLNKNVEETEKNDSHLKRRGDKEIKNRRSVLWTEKARLLVIKAVIQVEKEIIKIHKDPIRSSSLKGKEKWYQINALLPPHLQGTNPNCRTEGSNKLRCRSLFNNLVMAYKSSIDQERPKDVHHRMLTKPVQEMMKKREDMLNHYFAMKAKGSSKSGSPAKLKTCTPSVRNLEHLQATGRSSLAIRNKQGNLSGRRLRGKAPDQAGNFLKEQTVTQLPKRKLGALHFDSKLHAQDSRREAKRSRERHDGAPFRRRCATRSMTMAEAPEIRRNPVRSARKSAPKSVREYAEHSHDLGEPSAQSGVQPRAQTQSRQRGSNSSRTPAAIHSLSSFWMADMRYDELLQPILEKALQKIDQEFYRLGSWVQNRAIMIARQGFTEMTSPAIRSDGAWCNVSPSNATAPFDEFLHQSTSRAWVDLCVQTSFQKLRVRLAEEVKHTAVEVSQDVLRGIDLVLYFHAHPKND